MLAAEVIVVITLVVSNSSNSVSSSISDSIGSLSSNSSNSGSSNSSVSSNSRKKVLSRPITCGVILKLGTLPESWESEKTPENLHHSYMNALLQFNLADRSWYLG